MDKTPTRRTAEWIFILMLTGFAPGAQASTLRPERLTCENLENPLGIDIEKPRFSWTFVLEGRNQRQTAYEIVVSDHVDGAEGSVWASGKIKSSEPVLIPYGGKPLQSFTRYFWRVRVYDQNDQASDWSAPAWFETTFLFASDWQAHWIGDGRKQFERDEDFYRDDPMPLFRKAFDIKKKIQTARLYIAGLGYYEAYLNGTKIGDQLLDPGWTTYKKQVLYSVHDVTSLVRNGTNLLGTMLGNGWYNPLPIRLFSRFNLRDVQETGRPCMKAELRIRYTDGSVETVITDETWQTAPGPVVKNNVYLGEHYDARLERNDWFEKKADNTVWRSASRAVGPSGRLSVQMQPPIRITKILPAVSIKEISTGVFIADLGQNMGGVARIKVRGKAGTTIRLRYGEALQPDGTLNFLTTTAGQIKEMWHVSGGPGAPATAWQEDSYILKGGGTEVWSPRFTFHGFRYVEITGWPGKPDRDAIQGLRMNSDLPRNGEFACSNDMFNQLHTIIDWTLLSNVFSVQSDCPGREKMGYGADMVASSGAYLYDFDMSNFYRKAVQDFANDQQPDGGITEIAPYTGIADKGYGGESGPLGWELGFPYLQYQLYTFYGDKRIIADHYAAFQKQMEFLKAHAVQGLFHWDISDHEALDPRPEALSASAFYFHHAKLAATFAGILDKKEDSIRYAKLSQQIKSNIASKYLIPNTGRFDNATQSAQLFALGYDLSPEPDKTFEVLMEEFERHRFHVSSGIFGLKMMFDYLRQHDQNEVAYRIANQRDFPGWGYMLSKVPQRYGRHGDIRTMHHLKTIPCSVLLKNGFIVPCWVSIQPLPDLSGSSLNLSLPET